MGQVHRVVGFRYYFRAEHADIICSIRSLHINANSTIIGFSLGSAFYQDISYSARESRVRSVRCPDHAVQSEPDLNAKDPPERPYIPLAHKLSMHCSSWLRPIHLLRDWGTHALFPVTDLQS